MSTLKAIVLAILGELFKGWLGARDTRRAHQDVGRLEAEVAMRDAIREIRDEVQEAGARTRGGAADVARRLRARAELARGQRGG